MQFLYSSEGFLKTSVMHWLSFVLTIFSFFILAGSPGLDPGLNRETIVVVLFFSFHMPFLLGLSIFFHTGALASVTVMESVVIFSMYSCISDILLRLFLVDNDCCYQSQTRVFYFLFCISLPGFPRITNIP